VTRRIAVAWNGLLMQCPGGFVFRWCRIPTKTGTKKAEKDGARNDESPAAKRPRSTTAKRGAEGQKASVNVNPHLVHGLDDPGPTGGGYIFSGTRALQIDAAHWADGGRLDNAKRGYREGHFSTLPAHAFSGLRARQNTPGNA
jgi:hypothetical protein